MKERETWNQPHAINCNLCKHWICFSVTQGKSGFTAGYHWRGHWEKRRRGKSTWQWRANGPRLHIIWFDLKTDWWEILKGLCTYTQAPAVRRLVPLCLPSRWGPPPLHQTQMSRERPLPTPQYPWILRGTLRIYLRSPAQVEGTQGFLLRPEKDLESPSARLEARFPYNDSRARPAPHRHAHQIQMKLYPDICLYLMTIFV